MVYSDFSSEENRQQIAMPALHTNFQIATYTLIILPFTKHTSSLTSDEIVAYLDKNPLPAYILSLV